MNPELVKFHLPTTDQFSVAVDKCAIRPDGRASAAALKEQVEEARPHRVRSDPR
jgi:hypothetical protein